MSTPYPANLLTRVCSTTSSPCKYNASIVQLVVSPNPLTTVLHNLVRAIY